MFNFFGRREREGKGVILIVGMPYSGSTLLSTLLGCHKQIYGGADLYHLNGDRKGRCSVHGDNCDVLTKEALKEIYASFDDINLWYDQISKYTKKGIIVDASKQVSYFKEKVIQQLNRKSIVIALHKHPMRALASDVNNRLYNKVHKINTIEQILQFNKSNFEELIDFCSKRLKKIRRDLDERELCKGPYLKLKYSRWLDLKYEDYMTETLTVLEEILSTFDLKCDFDYRNYEQYDQHPVTGNLGVIWSLRGEEKNKNYNDYRKNYYLNKSKKFDVDDKYKDLFSEDVIAKIETLEDYKYLLEKLQYKSLSDE